MKFLNCSYSSTLHCLHCFRHFYSLAIYIYISSTTFTYCYFFKLLVLLSECDRTHSPSMLNSTQSIHKFFMCVLFETRSKSSLCPCQLKKLRTELLTYLIQIFGFAAQTVPHPTKYLSIHPRSNTISTSQYVGDTCRVKEKGQGHVRPKIFGQTVFTVAINTPLPFLTSFTPLDLSLPLELLKP